MNPEIDLRSDTVTRPGAGMLSAMMTAVVGDDVFGEDETTNELQSFAAGMFGMEAALYCPSGTMTNQIAIKAHTQPGDEIICEAQSHVYIYEGGGIAFNSACQTRPVTGDRGRITASQIAEVINPDDVHRPVSRLVVLENTANRGGGSCYDLNSIQEIGELCRNEGLSLHLDGARLFNALVAKDQSPKDFGKVFDSISICLSKGLGAPVGSLILGTGPFIEKCRRIRKVFGGGMRQSGYIAAAGLYALRHHVERLRHDHAHATEVASVLKTKSFVTEIFPVETNIIIFRINKDELSAKAFSERLAEHHIRVIPIAHDLVRMVFHLDVSEEMCGRVEGVIRNMK